MFPRKTDVWQWIYRLSTNNTGIPDPVPDFILHYKLGLNLDPNLTRVGTDDFRPAPECNDETGSFYNGSNQYETADPDSALVAVGTGPFSVSMWINTTGVTAADSFGSGQGGSGDGSFRCRLTGGGALRIRLGGANRDTIGSYNDDNWHLFTATSTGSLGSLLIYVDGALENTTTAPNYNLTDTGGLRVGSAPTSSSRWLGGLDGVRFYDRVLTPTEVIALKDYDCRAEPGFPCVFPCTFPVISPRGFTTLESAGSMYYSTPSIEMSGDFSIELESFITQNKFMFTGDTNLTWMTVNLAGELSTRINGTFIDSSGLGLVDDQVLHKFKVTRVSGAVTVYVDGVSVATNPSVTGSAMVDLIGADDAIGQPFSGIIANVIIAGGSVAGLPVDIWYPIDEDWSVSTNLKNNATAGGFGDGTAVNITVSESETFNLMADDWFGVELADDTVFDFTTTGIGEQVNQTGSGSLVSGFRYRVRADNATANTFNFVPFGGAYVSTINAIDDASSTALTWEGNQIGDYELSNITVKRILEVAP